MEREISFFSQKLGDEKKAKNKAEQLALLERLQVIVRTISGRKNLEVTTKIDPQMQLRMAMQGKDAGKEWFKLEEYDPKTRELIKELVHIPEDVTESEKVAKGKAAHEAGHVAITRYGKFIPDEVIQELGFHSVISAIEERPTDQVVRERYAGAGKWVDESRKDSILQASAAMQSQEQLGYMPKFAQVCDLAVYEPHFSEIPSHYDADVVKLYGKIKKNIERVEKTLPREESSETEIIDKAKERYKIIYSKIWPEIKKLVEQDRSQEELRQMIQDALKSRDQEFGEEGESSEGEGGKDKDESKEDQQKQEQRAGKSPSPLDQLPKELKEELESAISQALKDKEEKEKKAGQPEKPPEQSEMSEKSAKEKEASQGEQQSGQGEAESASGPSSQADAQNAKDASAGQPVQANSEIPVPMNQLSRELKESLEKIFDQLPKEKQQELKEKASEILEKIEDLLVKENSSELSEAPAETHEDYETRREGEEKEKERNREEKKIKEELGKIERHQAAILESSDIYDKTYEEIREFDEDLYSHLEDIFTPNVKSQIRLKSTGARLNLPAVFHWEADRGAGAQGISNRIFETVQLPEKKDYVFTLLVDLSGSMQGNKIKETFKAVVLLSEVLNRLGIKNEILGFQDEVIIFKEFSQDMNDQIRKKISGMLLEVDNDNPGGHNRKSYNDDGPCLLEASEGLEKQPGKEKFLLVLSDGLPEGRRSDEGDLKRAVKKIMATTGQKLVAAGLGPDTGHVKEYYPTSLPNINVQKLAETLGGLLEDIILNPQKYSYQEG